MSVSVHGEHAPAAGFEQPLDLISACHGQIGQQCAALRRLEAHLARHGADGAARAMAADVMRCFDSAAAEHHADEEQDLFPAVIEAMAGSDAVCVRQLTARLTAEHRTLERYWRRLRPALGHVRDGAAHALAADDVEALVDLCERHLAREERELLPMAARLICSTQIERLGHAMRARRGLGPVE